MSEDSKDSIGEYRALLCSPLKNGPLYGRHEVRPYP